MKFLLFPFSLVYGIIISIRNFLFDYDILPSREYDIPIVSVGNITVGGTGKTPHVEFIIDKLKDELNIAVLSRGYKRKTRGFLEVKQAMNAMQTGDEPLQIKRKFPEITVAVCERRTRGIEKILSDEIEQDIDLILLDDAFQHRYVKPGLNILLIDYNRLITKDFLLPYGRLREHAHQRKRADILLITKCPEEITPIQRRIMFREFKTFPYQNLYFTSFDYALPYPLYRNESVDKSAWKQQKSSILVLTGIANPKPVYQFLEKNEYSVTALKFADHHHYTEKDIQKIAGKYSRMKAEHKLILTTEKDAVHLLEHKNNDLLNNLPVYVLPVEVKVLNEDSENLLKDIRQYVFSNKRVK